jgi:hypothetical protein
MSSDSSLRALLEAFTAGRVPAERAATALAAAYYARPAAAPAALRELIGIVERAAPGIVELTGREGGPGFDVRPVGRPFPAGVESELRRATAALLATEWNAGMPEGPVGAVGPVGGARWWDRLVRAVRRLFSATP